MSLSIERASSLVFFWIAHIGWMGTVVWLVTVSTAYLFQKSSSATRYNQSLIGLILLAASIPAAAWLAYCSTPNYETRAREPASTARGLDSEFSFQELTGSSTRAGTDSLPDRSSRWLNRPDPQTAIVSEQEQPVDQNSETENTADSELSEIPFRSGEENVEMALGREVRDRPSGVDPAHSFLIRAVAAMYLLGFLVMLVRLLLAWWGCRRLIRTADRKIPALVAELVKDVRKRIGLTRTPTLALSERAKVPMLVGIWQPTILLPASIASGIPYDQLQAIIAHELFHLRRFDHFVLTGQRVVEAVLFFHPVTWLISRRLNLQRELCCDDGVISMGTEPLAYVRSLYRIASFGLPKVGSDQLLTNPATGTKAGHLIHRIRRILDPTQPVPRQDCVSMTSMASAVSLPAICFWLTFVVQPPEDIESRLASAVVVSEVKQSEPKTQGKSSRQGQVYPTIKGVVRNELGHPVKDATILIQEHLAKSNAHSFINRRELDSLRVLRSAKTAANGTFELENISVPNDLSYFDSQYPITIAVVAEQYAVAWKHLRFASNRPLEFTLKQSQAVTLNLKSESGEPLREVETQLIGWLEPSDWNRLTRTDTPEYYISDGLFCSPSESLMKKHVSTEGVETTVHSPPGMITAIKIKAHNQIPETVFLANSRDHSMVQQLQRNSQVNVRVSPVEWHMQPAATINITVLDKATGEPIEGAVSNANWSQPFNGGLPKRYQQPDLSNAATNGNGELLLEGLMPQDEFFIGVEPPPGNAWLAANQRTLKLSPGSVHNLKFELEKGLSITGRVVDAKTNNGIEGVSVSFSPVVPWVSDAIATTGITDANGQYDLAVMPTPGTVTLSGKSNSQFYSLLQETKRKSYPTSVDVNPNQNKQAPALTLFSPKKNDPESIRFDLLLPSGQPAANAKVRFITVDKNGSYNKRYRLYSNNEGSVEVDLNPILNSGQSLIVFAVDQTMTFAGQTTYSRPNEISEPNQINEYPKQLIKRKKSSEDAAITMELELQEMATIKGSVISSLTGDPVSFASVTLKQAFKDSGKRRFVPTVETDKNGRYELRAFPGLACFTELSHPEFNSLRTEKPNLTLNSGEVTNVTHRLIPQQKMAETKPDLTNAGNPAAMASPFVPGEPVIVHVLDENEKPVAAATVEIWTSPLIPLFPNNLRQKIRTKWTKLHTLDSSENGQISINASQPQERMFALVARTANETAGYLAFRESNLASLEKPLQIKTSPLKSLTVEFRDYDTGEPVQDCNVQVSFAKNKGPRIVTGIAASSDANGTCRLNGLIPGLTTYLKVEKRGYKDFGQLSASRLNSVRNGSTAQYQVELLSESSYLRALQRAELFLPAVDDLQPAQALERLNKHFSQAVKRHQRIEKNHGNSQVAEFMHRIKHLPIGAYRNAVRKIADNRSDDDAAFDALIWLLGNGGHYTRVQFDTFRPELVTELVDRFSNHEKIGSAVRWIKEYHPRPLEILKQITQEHPIRDVRGIAAMTIIEIQGISKWETERIKFSSPTIIKKVEEHQARERAGLNEIIEKYGDVLNYNTNDTLGDLSQKRIDWLDQYGIGGTAPPLSGKSLGGAEISLERYKDKNILLYFDDSSNTDLLKTLRKIEDRHGSRVQIIGVAIGDRVKAETVVAELNINWPVLWNPQAMEYTNRVWHEVPGLRWGPSKLANFNYYSTIVLSPKREIVSIGRTGNDLLDFIDSLPVHD